MKTYKTKIFYIIVFSVIWFTISTFTSNLLASETNIKSGKWYAVYQGGATPSHWECVYHWWYSRCTVGDTRTSDPNSPAV